MSRVFADTFYFVALSNPWDQGHQAAVEFTLSFQGEMVTTAWVLTEFANFMSDPRNRGEFVALLADLRTNPQVLIVPAVRSFSTREWSCLRTVPTRNGPSRIASH